MLTDAEDGGHVAVDLVADDAVLEAEDGLVDEARRHARLNLLRRHLDRLHERLHRLHRHGVGLHLALEHRPRDPRQRPLALLVRGVGAEARAEALALDACRLDGRHGRHVGPAHARRDVGAQVGVHVEGDIDADLVGEGDGADGEAHGLHGLVEVEQALQLEGQHHALVDVRRQAAVHVEARHVLAHHGDLALPQPDLHGRRHHGLRRALVRDHLDELHLVDGREVVHAHHVLGPLRRLGDLPDGQRRRVGRDDAVRRHDLLHTLNNAVLDADLLEDGLNHQVRLGKVPRPEGHVVRQPDEV